ncbi:MAG: ABC transporter ATP-binding protein [Luteolibacter sp.]
MHYESVSDDFQSGKPWRTLWALYRPQRRDLVLGELIYIVKASPVWGLPIITANIIDVLAKHPADGMNKLIWNASIGAALIFQNIPSGMLYARFTSRALRGLETSLRSALVRRLQLLSIGFHSRKSSGALQTKVLRDVESIEQMSRQLIDAGTFAVVSVLVAITVTAIRMPVFVPVFFLLIPIVVGIRMALSAKMKQFNSEFRHRIESMSSRVLGMITMIPVTRAHAAEDEAIARVESSFDEVSEAGQRLDRHGGLFGAVAWVCFMLLQLGVLITGAILGYQGRLALSPGDLVLLSGYVAAIVSSVMQLNAMLPVITRGFEAINSIGEVLEGPEVESSAGKLELASVKGGFTFEDTYFEYSEEQGQVATLRGLNLSISAGETIGIVGPSGSGKSTLMSLIIGFYQPTAGRVLLDGNDMGTINLRSYRRQLAVVSQETILFEGSLRENIAYGMRDISEARIETAIRAANAADFIRELPQGLDTMIGERGSRLSGGQRQRIAIARALLRDPRVLILDEATSALDGGSEAVVQEALDRLMLGRTTFIVAHRLSTLRRADRVVVLNRGRVEAVGSPSELALKMPARFGEFASGTDLANAC